MSKKEISLCFIFVFSCFFFSTSVESATYRLIPENFLAIGNHWEYQVHITKDEGDPVNWWGTFVWDITQSVNIYGYNTIKTQQVLTIPGVGSDTEFQYHFLSSEYWVEVREEGNEYYETVINEDPWEIFPIWISDTDNNRHVGHGQYDGSEKIPLYHEWTGYNDYYITYLRQETITVPAGTFNCIVVSSRGESHDDDGWWGYCNQNTWMNSSVGVIKYEEECWDSDSGETILTGQLTSTNVQGNAQALPSGPNTTEVTGDARANACVTLGSVVTGGDQMALAINFPAYEAAVDIYAAVQLPDGSLYLVKSDGSLTMDLVPYRTGVTKAQSTTILGSFDVCTPSGASVPTGTWNVYAVVTPTNGGNFSAIDFTNGDYNLWFYSFDVTCP